MNDREFAGIVQTFTSSVAYRSARALVDRVTIAGTESVFLRPVRLAHAWWRSLPVPRQIAFASTTIAWCALALIVARGVLPRYATSGLPWWWNVTTAGAAIMIAVFADRIATEWPHSTPARVWRRLVE